ncbi:MULTISPECIES: sodium-dependent transporter [Haloarcula]|uniref:Sodium-dependent transporter n=1 Tax=Haloarcula pellucida TaxID=1427151 RepID=A0A830GIW7_9EURY|nr:MULTISPECIES: sodium-dependent transporter [Halomicroarcula]MBX0347133.1 sodium-dependent transporter [Halomicroarcula pellucida]MDS0276992.1 sodium-dependent transporter [Halomicroarcula sp. S1AR25-4]GGN87142.1 sodium-dependent transporter [Halomicroarcula pellucida]
MVRATWRTRLGFVLAAVGSAVGLGNIWRFPWLTATNGGAAFLLLYVLVIVLVGVPGLLGEMVIGRRSRRNPVGAFGALGGRRWRVLGGVAVLASVVLLSFYSVVGGWILRYALASATGAYFGNPQGYFAAIDYGVGAAGFHVLFLLATIAVVYAGVDRGIEVATTVMVPGIVVLFGALAVWAATLPGSAGGYEFYLSLDVGYLRANFVDVLVAAAGQALFTLSVGAGAMLTYASYVDEDRSLAADGTIIAGLNTGIGVLAGLVIFPLLFSLGVSPGEGGPGALFVSLAGAFADLPYSRVVGVVFFGVVLLAALSSAISIFEVLVSYLVDEHDLTRSQATAGVGGLFLVTGSVTALSPSLFALLANTVANLVLTAGLLGFLLFDGWVLGKAALDEYEKGAGPVARMVGLPWYYAVAVALPLFLAFTLVSGLGGVVGVSVTAPQAAGVAVVGVVGAILLLRTTADAAT